MNQETKQIMYMAKHTFNGQESQSQLSFQKGSILLCAPNATNNPNDAWWLGSLLGNSKLGWFPSSYVSIMEQTNTVQNEGIKLTMMGGGGKVEKKKTSIKLDKNIDAASIAMSQLESFSLEKKSKKKNNDDDLFGEMKSAPTEQDQSFNAFGNDIQAVDTYGFNTNAIQTTSIDDAFADLIQENITPIGIDLFSHKEEETTNDLFNDKTKEDDDNVGDFSNVDTNNEDDDIKDDDEFGDFSNVDTASNKDENDNFGDFDAPKATVIESTHDDFGDFNELKSNDFGDFDAPKTDSIETNNDDDEFGDFNEPTNAINVDFNEPNTDKFGHFDALKTDTIEPTTDTAANSDSFGDFKENELAFNESMKTNIDDFGDFTNVETTEKQDDFGDFANKQENDNFGNFNTLSTNEGTNLFSSVDNEEGDDPFANLGPADTNNNQQEGASNDDDDEFGDFSNHGDKVEQDMEKSNEADDFGDFSNHGTQNEPDTTTDVVESNVDNNFGDFSNHAVEEDFGDFSNHDDAPKENIVMTNEEQTKKEDNQNDFGDFDNHVEQTTNDDYFGDFNTTDKSEIPKDTNVEVQTQFSAIPNSQSLNNDDDDPFAGLDLLPPPPPSINLWTNTIENNEDDIKDQIDIDFNEVEYPPDPNEMKCDTALMEDATIVSLPLSETEQEKAKEDEVLTIDISNILSMYPENERPPPPKQSDDNLFFPTPTTTTKTIDENTTSDDLFFPAATTVYNNTTTTPVSFDIFETNTSSNNFTTFDTTAQPATIQEDLFGDFSNAATTELSQNVELFSTAATTTSSIDLFSSNKPNDDLFTATSVSNIANDLFAATAPTDDLFATAPPTTTTAENNDFAAFDKKESSNDDDFDDFGDFNEPKANADNGFVDFNEPTNVANDDFGDFDTAPKATNDDDFSDFNEPNNNDGFGFDDEDEFDDFGTFDDFATPKLDLKSDFPILQEADDLFPTIFAKLDLEDEKGHSYNPVMIRDLLPMDMGSLQKSVMQSNNVVVSKFFNR